MEENKRRTENAGGRNKRLWPKLLLGVLAALAVAVCIVWYNVGRYVDTVMGNMAPESGAEELEEEIKTSEEYKGDVVSFLLCGIDYSGSETETADGSNDGLTDMILYFQFDVKNKEIDMLQIPRNTFVGEGSVTCSDTTGKTYKAPNGQINSVAKANSTGSEGNFAALADVVANNYKLPVDYYAAINMDALRELVDRFCGIEVYVPERLEYNGSVIEAGYHTLLSDEVEFLVRNRHTYASGDMGRLNMQRYFYAGLFKRIRTLTVRDIIKLLPVITYFVRTDCDFNTLVSLGVSFLQMDSSNIMICQAPIYSGTDRYKGNWVGVAAPGETADLLNGYFREYTGLMTADDMNLADWPHSAAATSANVQYIGQLDDEAAAAVAGGNGEGAASAAAQ